MTLESKIKLGFRFGILIFLMYLSYMVVSAEYLLQVKEMPEYLMMAIVGGTLGTLSWIVKEHFGTKIGD